MSEIANATMRSIISLPSVLPSEVPKTLSLAPGNVSYSHHANSPTNVYTRQSPRQNQKKTEEQSISLMFLRRECLMADLDSTMKWDDGEESSDSCDEDNNMKTADYAILRHSSSKAWEVNVMGTFEKLDDPYHQYLHAVPCYDLAPTNGAIIIMDSNLTLHLAFISLIDSGKQAALVWNGEQKGMVAMLTFTDFLEALLHADSVDRDDVHQKALPYFSEIPNRQALPLITVDVTDNIWYVAHRLLEYHLHRLPVMELAMEGDSTSETEILFMVTLKDIFADSFMKQLGTVSSIAPYMSKRIDKRRIGTWHNVRTISENDDLRTAVHLFLQHGFSSMPVLDENGRPITVLSKNDIIMLLAAQAQSTYKLVLNMPVSAAVSCRTNEKKSAFCSPSTTIGTAIKQLLQEDDFQCLFALDAKEHVVAAVSISDLMSFVLSSSAAAKNTFLK